MERTLRLTVELRKQFRHRRTRSFLALALAFPLLLVLFFQVSDANVDRRRGGFIEFATLSASNFVVATLLLSGSLFLPVVVATIFGDTIAAETTWSTLKELLTIPVPRHRLLRQKALVASSISLIMIVALAVSALTVGLVAYGAGQVVTPMSESLSYKESLIAIAKAVVYIGVQLTWLAGLSLMLSVCIDAPLGAVGIAVLVLVLSLTLDQIAALGTIRDYLPTHYARSWTGLFVERSDYVELERGAFTAFLTGATFGLIARHVFGNKDINS